MAGDSIELIIDGIVMDQITLTSNDVAGHQTRMNVATSELSDASIADNQLDLVIRFTQASTGNSDETEKWTYDWQ